MPGLVTKRFRFHNATQLYESFSETASNNYYIYIARVQAWPSGDTAPTPIDSVQESQYAPWRSMIAAKRVTTTDISFVVPKYDWASGTVYAEYSDIDTDLYTRNFYVLTDEYNVYKCLNNNQGAASTVKPTGTSTSNLETSDGYTWKYMYTMSTADAIKFLTDSYMPVKTLTSDDGSSQWDVQIAASNGAIEVIDLIANGTLYQTTANTVTSVTNSSVIVLANTASGVDDRYVGSTIFISSGLGAGQLRDVIDYVGATRTLTVNTGFTITPNTSSTYHVGPKIAITGDGENALAYANTVGGGITRISMINTGTQYSQASVAITANTGTGATALARISPENGHGSDPVRELGGYNVMLNVRISGTEGNTFPANNNFRSIGLLVDPLLANTSLATGTRYRQTTQLTISGISSGPFVEDEMISGAANNASGRIVQFANTNAAGTSGVLSITDVSGYFEAAETITGNTSAATASITSLTSGQLKPYSGDIIFRENRSLINRTSEQIEDVKLTIKF